MFIAFTRFAAPLALTMLAAPGPARAVAIADSSGATTFTFQFDNQGLSEAVETTDGPIVPPVVGSGTFVSPISLAAGTYALSALTGFTMSFSFTDGDNYSQTGITTPVAGVAVRIVPTAGGERLFFTETGNSDSNGGPEGGALDLADGLGHVLSFEPSDAGGNFAYFESPTETLSEVVSDPSGRYLAQAPVSSVPEPASAALFLASLGAVGWARQRRR